MIHIDYSKQYYTYVFGDVVLCKVLGINSSDSLYIQTEFGNKRNIDIKKLHFSENELMNYLIENKIAVNLTTNYLDNKIFNL